MENFREDDRRKRREITFRVNIHVSLFYNHLVIFLQPTRLMRDNTGIYMVFCLFFIFFYTNKLLLSRLINDRFLLLSRAAADVW